MNSSEQLNAETVYLTVAEYAQHFRVSENTVRTRINRNKLSTLRMAREGREVICIPVPVEQLHEPFNESFDEPFEPVQGTVHESFETPGGTPDEWFSFFRETLATVQNYSGQLVELSRENERYKLLSDNHTRTMQDLERQVEQLKAQLFEKDARIKELEDRLAAAKSKGWRFW